MVTTQTGQCCFLGFTTLCSEAVLGVINGLVGAKFNLKNLIWPIVKRSHTALGRCFSAVFSDNLIMFSSETQYVIHVLEQLISQLPPQYCSIVIA